MRHLLDTNVVSEVGRPRPNPGVVAFLEREADVWVSVILFEELSYGLGRAPAHRTAGLTAFVEAMEAEFGARALPVDREIARVSGRLRALAGVEGRVLHMADALMAATARVNGATLVTRNTRDFIGLGVDLLDPFEPG